MAALSVCGRLVPVWLICSCGHCTRSRSLSCLLPRPLAFPCLLPVYIFFRRCYFLLLLLLLLLCLLLLISQLISSRRALDSNQAVSAKANPFLTPVKHDLYKSFLPFSLSERRLCFPMYSGMQLPSKAALHAVKKIRCIQFECYYVFASWPLCCHLRIPGRSCRCYCRNRKTIKQETESGF